VRRKSQFELFCMLNQYRFSYQVIIDRINALFNTSGEVDHDQIKVRLSFLFLFNACII
jgi:hypothetical protein